MKTFLFTAVQIFITATLFGQLVQYTNTPVTLTINPAAPTANTASGSVLLTTDTAFDAQALSLSYRTEFPEVIYLETGVINPTWQSDVEAQTGQPIEYLQINTDVLGEGYIEMGVIFAFDPGGSQPFTFPVGQTPLLDFTVRLSLTAVTVPAEDSVHALLFGGFGIVDNVVTTEPTEIFPLLNGVGVQIKYVVDFIRGDANNSGSLNISDAVGIIQHVFVALETSCLDAKDTNNDGGVNVADVIHLLTYLFDTSSVPTLADPHLVCGQPAVAKLGCSTTNCP